MVITLGLSATLLWLVSGHFSTATGIILLLLWGAAYGDVSIALIT